MMFNSENPCFTNPNGTIESHRVNDIEVFGYRYVMIPLCIFGIVCNLLNLCVLLQRRLKESPYTYLTGLAVADLVTLISMSQVSIIRGDFIHNEDVFHRLTRLEIHIYRPLANYFGQVSTMITVALTIERYLFTTYPLHTRSFCKPAYARAVISVILVMCAIISSPRFLFASVRKEVKPVGQLSFSSCSTYPFLTRTSSSANQSDIGLCVCVINSNDPKFVSWTHIYYPTILTLNQILPFVILLFLNLSLIRRVQTSNRFTLEELVARQHYPITSKTPAVQTAKQKRLRDEHRLTKTLVSIVIVFLICNTFTIVSYPDLVDFMTRKRYPDYSTKGYRIQRLITNVMLLLNYSVNFFFYCAFNEKFLETFKSIFGSKRCLSRSMFLPRPTTRRASSRSLQSNLGQTNKFLDSNRNSFEHINYLQNQRRQQSWPDQSSRKKSEDGLIDHHRQQL